MASYVTGDTHGSQQLGAHSVDGFQHRFSTSSFPEQKKMSKADYVIICGDFGGVWDTDRLRAQESRGEKNALDWLEQKPFTTLFIPGNHENYDRLTGCRNERLLNSWYYEHMPPEEKEKLRRGYPREAWHGGFVRVIRPSVLMLERGGIFTIDGMHCFAFGGARSHDIQDGILDPADFSTKKAFMYAYHFLAGGMVRIRGLSWWDEEMPSQQEMEEGRSNLRSFLRQHDKIDFVFTHDAPAAAKILLGFDEAETDDLNRYLESLRSEMPYGHWFYGHLHDNRKVSDQNTLLYEQILRIH